MVWLLGFGFAALVYYGMYVEERRVRELRRLRESRLWELVYYAHHPDELQALAARVERNESLGWSVADQARPAPKDVSNLGGPGNYV